MIKVDRAAAMGAGDQAQALRREILETLHSHAVRQGARAKQELDRTKRIQAVSAAIQVWEMWLHYSGASKPRELKLLRITLERDQQAIKRIQQLERARTARPDGDTTEAKPGTEQVHPYRGDDGSSNTSKHPQKSTPLRSCCKVCRRGYPCGDSCISHNKTCHKPPGCAC